MIKAVIFDFNGTLYIDDDINKITWKETIDKLSNKRINFDEFFPQFRSTHDHMVVKTIIDMYPDTINKDIEYWVQYKEQRYRQTCLDLKRNNLAPGAEDFLNYLKAKNIKIGLCTSSIIENVNFYYSNVKLDRWFTMEHTTYDNGNYDDKTNMYIDCAKGLGINKDEAIIIEDSPKAIHEAQLGGFTKIIQIKKDHSNISEGIIQTINNFNDIDRSLFE